MQTTVKVNWPVIASVVAALSGVVGTVLTPLYGQDLTTALQAVLQALSALLLVIPTIHAGQAVVVQSRMHAQMALDQNTYSLEVAKMRTQNEFDRDFAVLTGKAVTNGATFAVGSAS